MNLLLCTDVYKTSHSVLYPDNTTKIYSYLVARNGKEIPFTVFYGLQYYIKQYLSKPITSADVDEFLDIQKSIIGPPSSDFMEKKLRALVALGYLPIEIKAVAEGTIMPVKNVLMTITNTHPDHAWLVGFLESLLLKVWNTTTVASYSKKLHNLCYDFLSETSDNFNMLPFQVHDFGYRGVSSEETAGLSGSAHLINFLGTDTVPAVKFVRDYYKGSEPIGLSVTASEHSVMCAYGRDNEFDAYDKLLTKFPTGILSLVSDTYDIWNVITEYLPRLKDKIMAREGKLVIRPDSGDPEKILLGDENAIPGTPESKGVIYLLAELFGYKINSKGYKVLDPHIGIIYGDGMYYERFERILNEMKDRGYSTENLVIGVGGLLLQQHSRDTQGFAIKATYAIVDGEVRILEKDPVTDSGKKSHKGLVSLVIKDGEFLTLDNISEEEEKQSLLLPVFRDGKILMEHTFDEIRQRVVGLIE